jgi:hypothetical protein
MGNKQIRTAQLIAPFGPGSIYTDRAGVPHVICGLDHWFFRWSQTSGLEECEKRTDFEKFEPRLSLLLHVDRFFVPPDFRGVRRGQTPPPNAMLYIPAQRFPRWYQNRFTRELRRFNLHSTRTEVNADGGWQPVRFIACCSGGHLCEFPWKEWIGCTCSGDGELLLTDRGGAELSSITIECKSCPAGSRGKKGKSLAGTMGKPNIAAGERSAFQQAGIMCPGDRPWLGEGANEVPCSHPLMGALINQTNLYFPKTISAISLPNLQSKSKAVAKLEVAIRAMPSGVAQTLWRMNKRKQAAALAAADLSELGIEGAPSEIEAALELVFDAGSAALPPGATAPTDPESELLAFRRAEFNIIREEINDAANVPDLRVISTVVPDELTNWISRVNLVERLRETRVFYGFERIEQGVNPLAGMPEIAMKQLFRTPPSERQDRWLPAIEVFGEGIYIELKEDAITQWQKSNSDWLAKRLDDGFVNRLQGIMQTLPPQGLESRDWASRYLLVHSLAHIFLNQLVFECGYSTASLRERLYVSADPSAPMAGFLVYTAAGDSEGTLGGLVRLGRADRLGSVMRRALGSASWCSADPVCSEHLGGQGAKLANLAACHACVLLPETSCETINHGLDRAMVVGTPNDRSRGFMASILEYAYAFD